MFHRIRREIEIARATQIDPASKPIGTLQRTAARCVNWLAVPITAARWTKRSDVTCMEHPAVVASPACKWSPGMADLHSQVSAAASPAATEHQVLRVKIKDAS